MAYYLCYFDETVGEAGETSKRIPFKAYAIDLTTDGASNPNKKGSAVIPIYLDNNGNFKECSISLSDLANMINVTYDDNTEILTLTITSPST